MVNDRKVSLCFVCIGCRCPVQGLSDNMTPLLQEYPSYGPILFIQLRRAKILHPCGSSSDKKERVWLQIQRAAIVFLQYLTVKQILCFFTSAVAEYMRSASMQASLGAPDSRCVHFALFNDACWGDFGILPLPSALGGPRACQHRFHRNRRQPSTMARNNRMHHVAVYNTLVNGATVDRAQSQPSVSKTMGWSELCLLCRS